MSSEDNDIPYQGSKRDKAQQRFEEERLFHLDNNDDANWVQKAFDVDDALHPQRAKQRLMLSTLKLKLRSAYNGHLLTQLMEQSVSPKVDQIEDSTIDGKRLSARGELLERQSERLRSGRDL